MGLQQRKSYCLAWLPAQSLSFEILLSVSASGAISDGLPPQLLATPAGLLYLVAPPHTVDACTIAAQVKARWSAGPRTCRQQIIDTGWTVLIQQLNAAHDGLKALLLPRRCGGFTFIVDPTPTPAERAAGITSADVIEWRLAHEYAHTFYYRHTPITRRSGAPQVSEELFCDAFATSMSGVNTASVRNLQREQDMECNASVA